jgi:hypothetical protein
MRKLVLLALVPTLAFAHTAPSMTWNYPLRCCWSPTAAPAGRPGDCDAIPKDAVKITPAGYEVSLVPGDHPMVTEPISFVVPYAEAEQSKDEDYHVCFRAAMQPRCFFHPPFGA